MRTELDEAMDRTLAMMTADGAPVAVGETMRDGRAYPMITTAPPALPHYFAHFCAQHADAELIVAGDERLTYAQAHAASLRVARALVAGHGIAKGDRVGIAMRNSPAWIILYMGILAAGGVATLLNGWWQAGELTAAIADVDCALVFADPPRKRRLGGIDRPDLVIEIDDALPLEQALAPVFAREADVALPEVTGEDLATILFTSGSTGKSKGAVSDHRAVVQATFNYLASALVMLGISQAMGSPPIAKHATLLTLPVGSPGTELEFAL